MEHFLLNFLFLYCAKRSKPCRFMTVVACAVILFTGFIVNLEVFFVIDFCMHVEDNTVLFFLFT